MVPRTHDSMEISKLHRDRLCLLMCVFAKPWQLPPVDDLRRYFETLYREGGESWKHLRTGIVVWKDAIDLSAGPGAKAFFHYTGELAFRNIVALEKEAAEVWASLQTEGESADAWWGRGVYSPSKISQPMDRPNRTFGQQF